MNTSTLLLGTTHTVSASVDAIKSPNIDSDRIAGNERSELDGQTSSMGVDLPCQSGSNLLAASSKQSIRAVIAVEKIRIGLLKAVHMCSLPEAN